MHKDNSINLDELTPGKVIAIRYSLYKHFAIISDCMDHGMPKLISFTHRTSSVLEESWHDVVGKRPVEECDIQGKYPNELVLKRARSHLNKKIKYNLFTFNCEHFARHVHGMPIQSIQVQHALYGAVLGAASCALLPKLTLARFTIATTTGAMALLKNSLNRI